MLTVLAKMFQLNCVPCTAIAAVVLTSSVFVLFTIPIWHVSMFTWKGQRTTDVISINLLGTMNICAKFCTNPM